MKRAHSSKGFTMIEVMVAISILVSMGALLYSSFALMARGQKTTFRLQERHHAARVAMSRMTRELSMAYLSKHVNAEEPRSKSVFLGDRNKIMFNTFSHQRRVAEARESDQAVVEYFLKSGPDDRGKGLYRRVKTTPDDDPEKGGRVELMLKGVRSLEFEYWDRMDEDWDSTWEVTSEDFEVGGAVAALTGGNMLSEDITDEDKTLQLPWRIKIRFELRDEEGDEFEFESQTAIYMREPLDFQYGSGAKGQGGKSSGGGIPKSIPSGRNSSGGGR